MSDVARVPEAGLARTVARLMAARWRITWNTLRRGARWRQLMFVVVGLAVVFLALMSLVFSYYAAYLVADISGQPALADVVVSSALSGGLILSFMVSFTVALAALFLSRDLDLLLAAPVARRAVFIAKLVGGLAPAQVVILGLTLLPLVGYGWAMAGVPPPYAHHAGAFYLAVGLALALLPVLPVSIGATAVVLIVRRVSAHRLGEVVGLVVVAMTLSIALVAGSARELREALSLRDLVAVAERIRSPYSPAEWLTLAVTAAGRGQWAEAARWFGLVAAVSAAVAVPLAAVSDRLYYEGWLHMQSSGQSGRARASRLPWGRVDDAAALSRPSGLFAWLPPPAVAVLRKDLRIIPRDLTSIAQVLAPMSIGVFFILQQLLYPVRVGGSDVAQAFVTPLLVMLSSAIAAGVSAIIMTRFSLTAFSIEGRAYWVIKGAPIDRRALVVAKFLVAYVPYLALGSLLLVLIEAARAVSDARLFGVPFLEAFSPATDPLLAAYAWGVMALVGAGMLAINLAIGAARPNLRWDSPHEMLTPDIGCLSLVLYGGYAFVAGLTLAVPAAVSRFAVIRHPEVLWVLGLSLGLSLTLLVVGGSYGLAAREVEGIGE